MGMADILRLTAVLLAAVLLQSAVMSQFPILGVTADLFLIIVVMVALSRGSMTGAMYGAVVGLLADVVFMEPLGMRVILYVAVGYGLGRFGEEFHPAGVGLLALIVVVASIITQTGYGLFVYITSPEGMFFTMLRLQIIPEALVDGLLAVPVYILLVRTRVVPGPETEVTLFS